MATQSSLKFEMSFEGNVFRISKKLKRSKQTIYLNLFYPVAKTKKMKYYPQEKEKILDCYAGEFESCFILFHPFLKMENEGSEPSSRISSNQQDAIPDELQAIFKLLPIPASALIYAVNQNYPTEEAVIENGIAIRWNQVIQQSKQLNSYQDVQKALMTSIGAYRSVFQRKDLLQALQLTLKAHKYWSPRDSAINTLTKKTMFEVFKFIGVKELIKDGFLPDEAPVDITALSASEFCQLISSDLMYAVDKEVMVVGGGHDTFFCLLLTKKKETMHRILSYFQLEGILCDEQTVLPWEFSQQEIESLIQKEQAQKNKKKSQSWWARIFKF